MLAVCCILYLNLEGLIVFFVGFFGLDFDGEMVGRFPERKAVANLVEICHVDFHRASTSLPFVERCKALATRVEHDRVAVVLNAVGVGANGIYGADV